MFFRNDYRMEQVAGLYLFYKPMIEQEFTKRGIPKDLSYICIIESMMNCKAISTVGAKGLWQFMPATGKEYGLRETPFLDDFFNPYLSTLSAVKFLENMYAILKDWNLVILAYNYGIGNVQRMKKFANSTSIYDVFPLLPKETKNYLHKFYAMRYLLTYGDYHDFHPRFLNYNYKDVVQIKFKDLPKIYIHDSWFTFLNPQIKSNFLFPNDLVYYIP